MALKDLIADKAALTEAAIENIVANHIHYYVEEGEIGFKPASTTLSNNQKILLYLTAILGWQYVTNAPLIIQTKPANLEQALGIPGGTLRPLLKILKDSHYIKVVDGAYTVHVGNLDSIASVVNAEKKIIAPKQSSTTKSKPKAAAQVKKNSSKKSTNQIKAKINEFLKQGYFDEKRTLNNVLEYFHENGIIVKRTSLSGPLLQAVKDTKLARKKLSDVWVYYSSTNKK